jgi:hypothetical protein
MMGFRGTMTTTENKSYEVVGAYTETDHNGFLGWSGWIQESTGLTFTIGKHYKLTLEDGRKGIVRITGMQAASNGGNASAFKSQGPTPR